MSRSSEQQHTAVIFDIDSASVAVAVLCYEKNQVVPKRELFSKRVQLDTQRPFEDFFAQTLRSLESLASQAALNSNGDIDEIYLVLSTPWMSSQKRVAHYKRKNPFVFTQKLAQEIIEKELADPLSKNLDFHHHGDLEIVERRTIDNYLNGYPSYQPFREKKKINQVDIHSITSVMSETTKSAFNSVIQRVFSREPQYLSNTFVMYQAQRTLLPDHDSGLLIDVGGTNTQVCVVENDHLNAIASFAVGRQHLVSELAERTKVSPAKARSLLALYTQEQLEPEYKKQLITIMDTVYRVWMKSWFELCDQLSTKGLLPSTIMMIAPSDISSWLGFHIMKSEELMEHMHSSEKPAFIDLARYLQVTAGDRGYDHVSDTQMLPAADVVGTLLIDRK